MLLSVYSALSGLKNLTLRSMSSFPRGQIILELKSSEAVSEDDPSNLDYRCSNSFSLIPRFYKIFDPSITKEGVDAASVSEYSSRRGSTTSLASHPGRAVSLNRQRFHVNCLKLTFCQA